MSLTHQIAVLNHFKDGKTLSQAEAIYHFDCFRLSAVVERLRKQGYDIVTHAEPNLNNKGTHARYELKGVQA